MKTLEKSLYSIKPDKEVGLLLIIPKFVLEKAIHYGYSGSPYDYSYSTPISSVELLEGVIVTGFILYAGYKITRKISDYLYDRFLANKRK